MPMRFTHEPIVRMRDERLIDRQDTLGVAARLQDPGPDLQIIRPQHQDRVIQLACHLERPPVSAECEDTLQVARLIRARRVHGDVSRYGAFGSTRTSTCE